MGIIPLSFAKCVLEPCTIFNKRLLRKKLRGKKLLKQPPGILKKLFSKR